MSNKSIQEAMLDLIEACGCWNSFVGPGIARDLRANRGLWRSAILVGPGERIYLTSESRDFVRSERDYSPHQGMPDTLYGFDVLQLAPVPGKESELETVANEWGADSVEWIPLPNAGSAIGDKESFVHAGGDPNRVIVELWWD